LSFFVAGLELGNAFSELTDGEEQERRFADELRQRAALGKTPYQMDHDYIEALRVGMPETGGIAVGVDRLVMLFADADTIADVTFFPVQDVFEEE
jgi:lysyl-tRNA synthetase class 2